MAEHLAWRAAIRGSVEASAHLHAAATLRLEAVKGDPKHEASGWAEEQAKTPNGRDTHTELERFYKEKLGLP